MRKKGTIRKKNALWEIEIIQNKTSNRSQGNLQGSTQNNKEKIGKEAENKQGKNSRGSIQEFQYLTNVGTREI